MEGPAWWAGEEHDSSYKLWQKRAAMYYDNSYSGLGFGIGDAWQLSRGPPYRYFVTETWDSPWVNDTELAQTYDRDIVRPAFWSTADQEGQRMAWDRMRLKAGTWTT